MTDGEAGSRRNWWGEFRFEEGALGRWRIGPLDLWVRRTARDWRYGAIRSDDNPEETLEIRVPAAEPEAHEALPEELARFGWPRTDAVLELVPALADRPVVARPAVPFHVPPHQRIELFVSTPIWIRLRAGGVDLAELACTQPSDTWFGDNIQGELSYATRTHMRRSLPDLPLRPHRAVTCLEIENLSDAMLPLERLSLPVPQLSLYASRSGALWTERVSVKQQEDGELAAVSLGQGPPRLADGGERVSEPRQPQGRSFGSLIFGSLTATPY